MARRTFLGGPALVALAATAILGLSRCEDRKSDPLGTSASEVKGLTVEEVELIGTQALEYALALAPNRSAAIVLSDREGRILFEACTVDPMTNQSLINRTVNAALDPTATTLLSRAESRALIGSFFSSEGEAFSVQTAFFIIQENFPPGTRNEDVGPLFGVENSSFLASDIIQMSRFDVRDDVVRAGQGLMPRNLAANVNEATDPAFRAFIHPAVRSGVNNLPNGGRNATSGGVVGAIGLEIIGQPADKGGLPLHRLGAHVGGIGVAGLDLESDLDVALAGQMGFAPPEFIIADHVFVDGIRFPYGRQGFFTPINNVPRRSLANLVRANLVHVVQGPRSTLQSSTAFPADFNRQIPPPAYIQATRQTLNNALAAPEATGAGITEASKAGEFFGVFRVPGSASRVRLLMPNAGVQMLGDIKDAWRPSPNEAENPGNLNATRDFRQVSQSNALQFNDVSLILRNAAEMALSTRAGIRRPLGYNAVVHIVVCDQNGRNLGSFAMEDATVFSYDVAFQKARTCAFFSDNQVAFSARGIGWVAQPHFPPGIDTTSPGPLFGLQGLYNSLGNLLHPAMNGFEVFPGGLPVYRNGELVGGVGVSGDGVDQDDQIAFGGQLPPYSAPANVRSDVLDETLVIAGISRGLNKIRSATIAAIASLNAQAPPQRWATSHSRAATNPPRPH
jgi:uncharacterized protein GlcG (DUF336 family)